MESYFPFSFFNMIFIPKNENNQMIINHEIAHTRQLHWLDLILIEIVSILLWFNPFVVLYKKSLKLQHEYLADASVINDNNIESYLICMLKQIQVVSFNGITSQFYCNTIKKRIIMITKNKTSNKYLGVYSLVLPLICFMLFAFSVNKGFAQNNTIAENEEVIENTLNQPSIYPVDSKKIKRTSAYYGKRENPVTKKAFFHHGMDFAIAEGENVVSTANGVVIEAEFDSKKGNYVIIQHNEVFSTLYSHLKSISVQVGDKLVQNQTIGYVGNTGRSTGSHLHYEVFKDGKNVNPEDYLPKQ
ncbi:peptidoglycan DD-metalloendopeptidase family protein [Bacteroides sp. 519]|uniref:peptidoglycan DD-metalloendopeptidase family protein n=1 Tax=Bacteroides sp. 519 TaxID=2302937 RepID=UPI001EF18806|nr:peptidoglycan DD-metalloendopeptidase family protein [Bacteroides sp. 519]